MDQRRALSAVAALCTTAALPLLCASPAGAAARQGFSFSTTGLTAESFFSTLPAGGQPVAGREYTDVYLTAADQATRSDGTSYQDDFAYVEVFSYTVDRRGNLVAGKDSSGVAQGAAVSFTGDRKLGQADLSATVALTTCDSRGCSDAGTQHVTASWTGTGESVRISGTSHVSSRSFVENSHQNGSSRSATGTGVLGSTNLGQAQFANLFYGSYSDRFVCHTGTC